jgi:hypothetical protein
MPELHELVDSGRATVAPASFAGISVAPNGAVLMADQVRKQLARLWPKNPSR